MNETNSEKIESDGNPFPSMDILPGIGWIKRIGGMMISHIYFFRDDEIDSTGGGPLLDKHLEETWTDEKKLIG